jgi:outer membrane biogenesis lipoprotein LolB
MKGYKQLRRRFRNLGYLGVAMALLAACCTLMKRRSPR